MRCWRPRPICCCAPMGVPIRCGATAPNLMPLSVTWIRHRRRPYWRRRRNAVALGVTAAVLTGVTGRRTDHTLWNLSLLKRYADRLQLLMVDDYCHIRLLGAGTVTHFHARVGLRLSLSPLDGAAYGVTTTGLRWSLTDENLVPGQRDGISNEVVISPVSVCVAGPGDLLLMVHREGETAEIEYFDPS